MPKIQEVQLPFSGLDGGWATRFGLALNVVESAIDHEANALTDSMVSTHGVNFVIFLSAVGACDWALEPWVGFQAVTAATDGAPTAWQSDGAIATRTYSQDCLQQTLILTQHVNAERPPRVLPNASPMLSPSSSIVCDESSCDGGRSKHAVPASTLG